ncbi:hypothetical protein [Nocardioides sp. Root140]|uniref:hypothetical protein n=1 Tax=Nocardioides sp. Root140 TaxID=1736460 RepID=UPI0006F291F7|nr:hypothetical protein [Nocardioides sp. Root140]KQY62400.1 hypothetical protein ASD30_23795 [Nocardioides sp. Root140]
MNKTVLPLVVLALLGLGACGDDSRGGGDDESSGTPACSDVWEVGETLDLNTYEGCEDGDSIVAVVTMGCYDADSKYVGQFTAYEDRLWVVQSGTDQKTGDGGTPGKITDVDPEC